MLIDFIPAIAIAFLLTFYLTRKYMVFVTRIGVTGIDQQKKNKPELPTAGGIPVFVGIMAGLMLYILITTFSSLDLNSLAILKQNMLLLASILSIAIITSVGFFDDIYMHRESMESRSDTIEKRIGLKQWLKPLLTFFGAVPLIVVMAGTTSMSLPFLGIIEFGLLYPLILIPLAVICVSNATNMLAGLNGLETGLMVIASFTLGLFTFFHGRMEASILAFVLCFALLAFLRYNWFPAKILPGDSLTYLIGGAFATIVIIGNVEKFGILIFAPWILEALLKLRGKFNKRSFGDLQEDGTVKAPYNKIYSLTHVAMKLPVWLTGNRLKENQAALLVISFEILICVSVFTFYSFVVY